MLLSGVHAAAHVPSSIPSVVFPVFFEATTGSLGGAPIQMVTQQAGEATVTLSRTDTAGSLQVEVTTGPSSYVGVNVGAVDQTVTFADGQSQATLTVPILAGAPNPGEVDVYLVINPVNHRSLARQLYLPYRALDLRIVASDPTLPPKVVSIVTTNQGILLGFNKPMDPVGASNVNNYPVMSW